MDGRSWEPAKKCSGLGARGSGTFFGGHVDRIFHRWRAENEPDPRCYSRILFFFDRADAVAAGSKFFQFAAFQIGFQYLSQVAPARLNSDLIACVDICIVSAISS